MCSGSIAQWTMEATSPEAVAARAEAAIRHVLAEDQPLLESDQRISAGGAGHVNGSPDGPHPAAANGGPVAADPQSRHWAFSWFPSHDPDGGITLWGFPAKELLLYLSIVSQAVSTYIYGRNYFRIQLGR